jgi:hypothetical protein
MVHWSPSTVRRTLYNLLHSYMVHDFFPPSLLGRNMGVQQASQPKGKEDAFHRNDWATCLSLGYAQLYLHTCRGVVVQAETQQHLHFLWQIIHT